MCHKMYLSKSVSLIASCDIKRLAIVNGVINGTLNDTDVKIKPHVLRLPRVSPAVGQADQGHITIWYIESLAVLQVITSKDVGVTGLKCVPRSIKVGDQTGCKIVVEDLNIDLARRVAEYGCCYIRIIYICLPPTS